MNDDNGEYITRDQLCARWRRTSTTIWRYEKYGIPGVGVRLESMKRGGRKVYDLAVVEAIEWELEIAAGPRIGGN